MLIRFQFQFLHRILLKPLHIKYTEWFTDIFNNIKLNLSLSLKFLMYSDSTLKL